jgi:alginate O-acetyltransferase complex protein AlgI
MIFNSAPFFIFFTAFFLLYWLVFNRNLKLQNLLILTGSYVFYAWWDWRFLFLLAGYSLLNFLLGLYMGRVKSQRAKNWLMYTGVIAGLGSLLYFKYSNFFITSLLGIFPRLDIHTIQLILPLGISFYTFRTLSYLFDIHKGKMQPTTNWVAFFAFVAFFPCLLSGPVDKAKTLLPQLQAKRNFNYTNAADALRQILWGLFKKIVIADNLSLVTNNVYDNYLHLPGSTLLIGIVYFAIQLYADFSGYSDMAIGIARLLGFNITRNFDYPFFAQNIAEFWRKWHISLTSWLTEYVFTPLSITFRDYDKWGLVMAIMINFTLIGIWHGANWTFVLFGILHGFYYIPLIIKGTLNKKKKIALTGTTLPLWNLVICCLRSRWCVSLLSCSGRLQ